MNWAEKSTAELLKIYNDKAFLLDRPQVKRFADRATAEKRVNQIMNATNGVAGKAHPTIPAKTEPSPKAAKPTSQKRPISEGPLGQAILVRGGSYRDRLLGFMERNAGAQHSISELMKATYGEARKDFKGPLMMVIKGLRGVLAANRTGVEIRKTRENKENHFGLHKKN